MAVLNWFSKKKKKQSLPKSSKKQDDQKEEKQSKQESKKAPTQDLIDSVSGRTHQVLHSPHVTEKSTLLAQNGKYVFVVFPRANAPLVKEAIEDIYHVHVSKVHMITVPSKKVRRGRRIGKSTRMPRAIVTLRKGETIDILTQ